MRFSLSEKGRYVFGVTAAALFGISIRLIGNSTPFWIMTVGFLVFVPFAMGWLTISYAQTVGEDVAPIEASWKHAIFLPWPAMMISDLALLIAGLEGMICIVFAVPITFFFSSIGGVSAKLAYRHSQRRKSLTACIVILPIVLCLLEAHLASPEDTRTVQTSISIHAPAQVVWDNIKRVPAISPAELPPTWTHAIGFPRPIEATLSKEGVGGVRRASFEHDLVFFETVHTWEPLHKLGFSIKADTANIPPTTLDQHVTIGGRYFDVLNGEYELDHQKDGSLVLHLRSRERLSTDFNPYAGFWSDVVMRDLQQSILQVIKKRCEDSVQSQIRP